MVAYSQAHGAVCGAGASVLRNLGAAAELVLSVSGSRELKSIGSGFSWVVGGFYGEHDIHARVGESLACRHCACVNDTFRPETFHICKKRQAA